MSKNIVIFSDGTGNSAAKANKTNVWRLYKALDLSGPDQVAIYDDGVGTDSLMPLRILGGAVGYGLKANVIELYESLCRTYRDGDRIYMFGFSRGGFTVRTLASMIHHCGLATGLRGEALHTRACASYAAFRKVAKTPVPEALVGQRPEIAFLGIWDTVAAYGLPIKELTDFVDKFIYRFSFRDRRLTPLVRRACHALALDDERLTFHPLLWDQSRETTGRIEQVWFAGAHANVGGGYPDDNLSLVALDWMITKVEAMQPRDGLVFIPPDRERIARQANVHGKLYDSRAGLKSYYRFRPRRVEALCDDKTGRDKVVAPVVIHESVFERIRDGMAFYAPLALARSYAMEDRDGAKSPAPPLPAGWETAIGRAWGFVRRRMRLYYLMLAATLVLAVFPFAARYQWPPGLLAWNHARVCALTDDGPHCAGPDTVCGDGTLCSIEPLIAFAGNFLPSMADMWALAFRQNPVWVVGFLIAFYGLLRARSHLRARTVEHAESAWLVYKDSQAPPTGQPAR